MGNERHTETNKQGTSSKSIYFPVDLQPYPSFELRIVAINSPYLLDAVVAGIYLPSCIVNE